MTRKHIFRLDVPDLQCPALGNQAVWAIALHYAAQQCDLDAYVVLHESMPPDLVGLWKSLFGDHRVVYRAPPLKHVSISYPHIPERNAGLRAPTIFENALWESGFQYVPGTFIDPPVLYRCRPESRAALVYPVEYKQANAFYDRKYWLDLLGQLRADGWTINLLGHRCSTKRRVHGHANQLIREVLQHEDVDHVFPPDLDGFARAVAASSLAIGASTGPSWACLLSDIPQIVLEQPRSDELLWSFERNQPLLAKAWKIVHGDDPVLDALPAASRRASRQINVRFDRGLGEAAHLARLIRLYTLRGYDVEVSCPLDKRFLFECAEARTVLYDSTSPYVPLQLSRGVRRLGEPEGDWRCSQAMTFPSRGALPDIGARGDLWQEYCNVQLDVAAKVPVQTWRRIDRRLCDLPRPIVLLHTMGGADGTGKNLPQELHVPFYEALLDRTDGTLIVLDWDRRIPVLDSHRIRRSSDQFGVLKLHELAALMHRADLLVGVDSGPLHMASITPIKTIGIWLGDRHPAGRVVPQPENLNIVLGGPAERRKRRQRIPYHIVEHPGSEYDPHRLASDCAAMLGPPRYLDPQEMAADVQLQQFVLEFCRGATPLSEYADRNLGFDRLLTAASRRFERPTFVETGCIREREDWKGAGFSTYLFGAYLYRRGGILHSVDIDPAHCEFARQRTSIFKDTVQVHQGRGNDWLAANRQPIDVLYLDSTDRHIPSHAVDCRTELLAAMPRLHERSLVMIDDTILRRRRPVGKGSLAVPWLLDRGWRVLYGGYQVLLCRDGSY